MASALLHGTCTRINIKRKWSVPIELSCSLTQGCPLAPLLFAIAANTLGWLVERQVEQEKITGIKWSIQGMEKGFINELFADDMNFTIGGSDGSIQALSEQIATFH